MRCVGGNFRTIQLPPLCSSLSPPNSKSNKNNKDRNRLTANYAPPLAASISKRDNSTEPRRTLPPSQHPQTQTQAQTRIQTRIQTRLRRRVKRSTRLSWRLRVGTGIRLASSCANSSSKTKRTMPYVVCFGSSHRMSGSKKQSTR